jgi:hypothetical protein
MRFRLRSTHSIDDRLLEEGTEITPARFSQEGKLLAKGKIFLPPGVHHGVLIPGAEIETEWRGPPSAEMEGVDTEAQKAVADRLKGFMMPVESLPIRMDQS